MNLTIKGEAVPALGFGTWQLQGKQCREAVADALALGYRHLDTAQAYENEAEVGQALRTTDVAREDVFLVTKVRPQNFAHDRVLSSTQESLKKLGVDYVDLLLMHWPNPDVPLRETLDAFNELQGDGRIRHIGVSNFSTAQVEDAELHATIFCNQVKYHPYEQPHGLVQQAKAHGYMLTAYSPLARGEIQNDPVLQEIGSRYNKSVAQVALRWLVQQGVAAIPKAGSAEHRKANFTIFDFALTEDEMQTIFALRH
ncbi:MAG: aldo/keto reductase [Caldilineaceae bacterium]